MIKISDHIVDCFSFQFLFSQERQGHAAVVLSTDHIIVLGGYDTSSRYTGEIVRGIVCRILNNILTASYNYLQVRSG